MTSMWEFPSKSGASDADRGRWVPHATFWLVALIPFAALTALGVSFVGVDPAPISAQVAAAHDGIAAADLLWLPADARLSDDAARPVAFRNGRSIYVDGSAAVAFSIESDQRELSRLIVEHFATTSWRQRRRQHANPSHLTSFEHGWQDHGGGLAFRGDALLEPPPRYRRWYGEWEDEAGNLITYHLGGQGRRLQGYASYVPRLVRDGRAAGSRRE